MLQKKSLLFLFSSVACVASALAFGCSPKDSGGGNSLSTNPDFGFCAPVSTCPPDVSGADLTTPVSFREDLYTPIMISTCSGGTACHAESNNDSGIAFGDEMNPLNDDQISNLILQLKGQKSKISGIVNVVPGDWEQSYMMMKLDGCQNQMGLDCDPNASGLLLTVCEADCGDGMPASDGDSTNPTPYPLTEAQRNLFRAWIAQGAPDN